jgi:subtilisin family serine protease
VALTAGLSPASAAPQSEAETGGLGTVASSGEGRMITLITGDRVALGPDGEVRGLVRAEGREGIPVQLVELQDSTLVLPMDVAGLIQQGKLDQRLFDITELSRAKYDEVDGIPVIVSYQEGKASAARAERTLHAEAGPEVRAELESINAEALTFSAEDAAAAWEALTAQTGQSGAMALSATPGIAAIALDGIAEATLDTSVPQVGAPDAWDLGLDGGGVTIAVLDTGIDAEHGDFSGKITASRNFTEAPTDGDLYGHGTHVASIAAGTGDRSGGTYRGVAPGAALLNGKVLDDDGGGWESEIIEGMEWAVDQGADIINMSLGGGAGNEIDPMEEAVNQLSADSGALFVIAAGNSGPGAGSVGTPGTADAALTAAAVDKGDELARFSSVGPRGRDGALKPDMAAPGVDIGAAAATDSYIGEVGDPVADGYVAISGTSMATPHIAGAAALLAQQHPEWTGEQLKGVLTGSALGLEGYAPTQQGTGRLDVTRALEQTVTTDANALNFGLIEWPHEDSEPIARELTYSNAGDTDVTLDLTATGTGPDGEAAPEGMFTLGADQLTVPAGGTATVEVTADARHGGEVYGAFGVFVTGTGDGQSVRSAGVVDREAQKFDVTIDVTGRDGQASDLWDGLLIDPVNDEWHFLYAEEPGPVTIRLPENDYLLHAVIHTADLENEEFLGLDMLLVPNLTVNEDTSLSLSSDQAEEVSMSVPDRKAQMYGHYLGYEAELAEGWGLNAGFFFDAPPEGIRSGQVGASGDRELNSSYLGYAKRLDNSREYHGVETLEGAFFTGLDVRLKKSDLAKVTTRVGSPAAGPRDGLLFTSPTAVGAASAEMRELPFTVDVYVQARDAEWQQEVWQMEDSEDGWDEFSYFGAPETFQAKKSYQRTFNVGVFGPSLAGESGIYRVGDELTGWLTTFTDGSGHSGYAMYDSAETVLYRNGEVYATSDEPLDWFSFEVPEELATYRLVSTVNRGESGGTRMSTELVLDYTFTSERGDTPGEDEEDWSEYKLDGPSAVRFTPKLALDSTAPAGRRYSVPVAVEGLDARPKSLGVEVSYDGGESWKTLKVHRGKVRVQNPAAGGSVSFRATVEDQAGNQSVQTIIDAYRTK